MSPVAATAVEYAVASLAVLAAFALGWLYRGSVEHQRARRREARRLARVGVRRTTVARNGTTPARIKDARIGRKEMQETD